MNSTEVRKGYERTKYENYVRSSYVRIVFFVLRCNNKFPNNY